LENALRTEIANPARKLAEKVDVGGSATAGMTQFSYSRRSGEVTANVAARFPSLGASMDFRYEHAPAPTGSVKGSVGIGLGENSGLGFNFAVDTKGRLHFTGLELNLGVSTPSPRVLPSVEAGEANLTTGKSESPLCGKEGCGKP
jgi:hypothetical protein